MSLFSRFLVYFGGAFLGLAVIIMSFLRRKMINRSKQLKRHKRMQSLMQNNKTGFFKK
jgi:hypothetical protein